MDITLQSLQSDTILLLAVTAFVGGVIGSGIKYVFEYCIPARSVRKQMALDNFERYKNKLLKASGSLISNLNLYMRFLNEESRPLEEDDYSCRSLVYAFSSFFGWNKIMEEQVLDELDLTVYHRQRKFRDLFYRSNKSLSSSSYFRPLRKADRKYEELIVGSAIKAHDLKRISSAMVIEKDEGSNCSFSILDILEFENRYRHDPEFRKVFDPLLDFLKNIKRDPENLYWCRATILLINLQSFMNLLDKHHIRTNENRFDQLYDCHPLFREHIYSICSSGEKRIIREKQTCQKNIFSQQIKK